MQAIEQALFTNSITVFHFVAGLSTGAFSAILLQPADLLKTRVQQSGSTSVLTTFRQIVKSPNSFRQLWRGTAPSVIRTGVGSAFYFSILDGLRQRVARSEILPAAGLVDVSGRDNRHLSSPLPKLSNVANLTTGAIARVSAGFLMTPVTVIKVRYESSLYSYKSILSAGSTILRTEGLKGFFAGFGATAVRDAPYAGLYVLFYEQSKSRLAMLRETSSAGEVLPLPSGMGGGTSAATNFASGIVAACLATTITNPFDAIKTRLQLMPDRYRNMVGAGRQMVREDGFRSLFDGLSLRIGRKALSSALTWTLYEEVVRRAQIGWKKVDDASL